MSTKMIQDATDEAMREHSKNVPVSTFEKVIKKKDYDGEEIEVVYRRQPISAGFRTDYYAPLEPGTYVVEGNILYERDIAVELRDGRKIYVDVYRPLNATNIPAIAVFTPFGKRHWYGRKETPGLQQAMGVPRGTISKLPPFESPDPSYWCSKGYAVVNADAPGTGYSEGDFTDFSVQGGKDAYDYVEWIGTQKWCNGKVGSLGNSAIAMWQYWCACENPPHLAAIAPWEGTADHYRDQLAQGGIPHPVFPTLIFGDVRGPGLVDDIGEMIKKYPMINGYWESKNAPLEKIKVPIYLAAGYGHPYHLRSTVQAFNRVKSKKKWIRLHREFEWPDFNRPENIEDVNRFFDRYLKEIHNGWEMTPPVRVTVTDAYEYDYVVNRPESEWPIARTEYTKFYLNASDGSLGKTLPEQEATITYEPNTGETTFEYTFEEDTEITGHSKLHLWVATDKGNEADVFVHVRKLSSEGKEVAISIFGEPDPGFVGKLRASHRELDEKRTKEYLPWHTHKNKQPIQPGEIVPLDIEIWPNSRIWHKGEKLQILIAGRVVRDESWFLPTDYLTENEGNHIIYTGGKYDSYFLAPIVPPKYTCGDYVYRG